MDYATIERTLGLSNGALRGILGRALGGDAKTSENQHRSFLLNAMVTIHENINEFLAADLHGELSESEREELHTHLMECAECRSLHKEEQLTHKLLQATVERAKPPLGFEQRMISSFRNRVPNRNRRLSGFFVNALRWRAIQAVGVAALFFVLVQMGRFLSGDADLNFAQTPLAFLARMQTDVGNREKDVSKESSAERVVTDDRNSLASADSLPAETSTRTDTAKSKSDQFAVGSRERNLPRPESATSDGGGQVALYSTGRERESDSVAGLAYQPARGAPAEGEPSIATGSNVPSAEEVAAKPSATPAPNGTTNNRKLVRNANVDLEVKSFDEALQSISALASEGRGYVATTSSEKQENGKLRGQIVVKVLPENLDDFLAKLRKLGDVKNQTLAAEDVTKQYVDTDARLRNARLVEQRLVALLRKKRGPRFRSPPGREGARAGARPSRAITRRAQGDGHAGPVRHRHHLARRKGYGDTGGISSEGTRPALALRSGRGETLRGDQRTRFAQRSDH
jgi:hypothetical protein